MIEEKIKSKLRELGQASRPELAIALGYSKVYINRVLADMVARGDVHEVKQLSSSGGRPARLYELYASAAHSLLIRLYQEGHCIIVIVECLDAKAHVVKEQQYRYSSLLAHSFHSLLDDNVGSDLNSVCLCCPENLLFSGLRTLVWERCACPLHRIDWIYALADRREGSLSILYAYGQEPQALICNEGSLRRTGRLGVLPTPIAWDELKKGDNATLEEMIALIVLYLCSALAPTNVCLYADFWNERLEKRVRYNCKIKLRDSFLPPLFFFPRTSSEALSQLRRLACM